MKGVHRLFKEADMILLSPGWTLGVDRGPDWLIVSVHADDGAAWVSPPLAAHVWALAEQHFTYRVVVDLTDLPMLPTSLIGELVRLQKRICMHDGVLRLCGLSEHNRDVLHSCRLDGYFPSFHDRNEAVMGQFVPAKPR